MGFNTTSDCCPYRQQALDVMHDVRTYGVSKIVCGHVVSRIKQTGYAIDGKPCGPFKTMLFLTDKLKKQAK